MGDVRKFDTRDIDSLVKQCLFPAILASFCLLSYKQKKEKL